jgi:putative membrane protein
MAVHDIPALNATLNGIATALLLLGYCLIRARRIAQHRLCMTTALVVSILFLTGYVTHKILVHGVHTPFGGTGAIRVFYYGMLITHIILAMAIVPLVLRTFFLARRGDFARHRAWARWTFPLWLYVSVTGVLVYFFLYQWFPAAPAAGVT